MSKVEQHGIFVKLLGVILNICFLVLALSSISCTSIQDRSIMIKHDHSLHETEICAMATEKSLFDPDGWSRTYQHSVRIRVFGKGRNKTYVGESGTFYMSGEDFDVNVDYCATGYIWVSDDHRKIGIALFDVDPPTGISASVFNCVYTIPEGVSF